MTLLGVSVTFLMFFLVVQSSEPDAKSCDECPPLWTRFGDNCYRFFGTPKTWQEAESHCQEFYIRYNYGHLASVRSQKENTFLQQFWSTSLVPREGPTGMQVWVGLNDIEYEGIFVWSDGSDFGFNQWYVSQPDDFQSSEDCVEIVNWEERGRGTVWNDRPCDVALPHLCQIYSP